MTHSAISQTGLQMNALTTSQRQPSLLRRIGLGRLAYLLYYQPVGFIRRCWSLGPLNLWLSRRGRLQMEQAAHHLPPIKTLPPIDAPAVHYLTGRRFWYQTCFCAWSLMRFSPLPLRLVIYDDGSLDAASLTGLTRVFPAVEVIGRKEVEQRLDQVLPISRFPSLRQRRLIYPHLRKLTDVHAGSTGWKLVLDSDMLFFREPKFLLDWLQEPTRPCHMVDVETIYGYPNDFLVELTGVPLAERINVGICGLRSEDIDWDRLEFWCHSQLERVGSHYCQEQGLTAMLLAGKKCAVASEADYVALPGQREVLHPRAVMHHYVAESKAWYFRFGWKHTFQGN